jgi:hypothetical protein
MKRKKSGSPVCLACVLNAQPKERLEDQSSPSNIGPNIEGSHFLVI